MLDITRSPMLREGYVYPTRALAMYLELEEGPTDKLVYAAVENLDSNHKISASIIEAIRSILRNGNFKVGQVHGNGDYLVKCSSATDADKQHLKAKVCGQAVIGFQKMHGVTIHPNPFICPCRDATPEEFTDELTPEEKAKKDEKIGALKKKMTMEKYGLMGKHDDEAGGSKKRKM